MRNKVLKTALVAVMLTTAALGLASIHFDVPVARAGAAIPTPGNISTAVVLIDTAKSLTQGFVDKGQPVPTGNAFAANILLDAAVSQLGGRDE